MWKDYYWFEPSARFWLKKLLAQVHATPNIYLHNIVGTCTKEGLNKENTTQIAKYKKHSDLIPWKFVEMSNLFVFLFILKFVTKKLHAQCACRLGNLLAQMKKCMHLCKCACVKSSTVWTSHLKLTESVMCGWLLPDFIPFLTVKSHFCDSLLIQWYRPIGLILYLIWGYQKIL